MHGQSSLCLCNCLCIIDQCENVLSIILYFIFHCHLQVRLWSNKIRKWKSQDTTKPVMGSFEEHVCKWIGWHSKLNRSLTVRCRHFRQTAHSTQQWIVLYMHYYFPVFLFLLIHLFIKLCILAIFFPFMHQLIELQCATTVSDTESTNSWVPRTYNNIILL